MSNATKVASEPGVGTRKLFENDKVIVWDFVLPVGAETPVHTHDHSYMWFAVQPRWPGQIPPPLATPNSPRQDRSDYDDSGVMAMRAAASLRR